MRQHVSQMAWQTMRKCISLAGYSACMVVTGCSACALVLGGLVFRMMWDIRREDSGVVYSHYNEVYKMDTLQLCDMQHFLRLD
jgi:hypothetical protein